MPIAIPNGSGDAITSAELTSYASVIHPFQGDLTAQQQQVRDDLEGRVTEIAQGWTDSGGPGGHQTDVALEVLERAALLQGDLAKTIRQWAKPGRERALMEMFGLLTKALVERDRLLLELRNRLNDTQY